MALHLSIALGDLRPRAALRDAPPEDQIVEGPITYVAHCARHGMPYFGQAYVGYVPTADRLDASTLRRMVGRAARRGEDRFEEQIAAMLQVCIHPAGVALALRSSHDCAGPRLLADDLPRRTAWHGRYRADRSLRSEFLARCGDGR